MAVASITSTKGSVVDDATLQAFIATLRGAALQPGDGGYDQAREVRNGLIDRRPGLIVQPSGAADVIAAVNFAREHDLLLSVKGGGHNVAGNAVNDDGLVIDLSMMKAVHIDPERQIAHVQGGATWGELDRESQVFGLATPGGVVSTTGVAGLTLHGGMGHLRSKHGLSIDNVRSVQIVTADGELRTASATENADLFWAVCGAGSNFGVVTSFEFQLHPLGPTVYMCAPVYRLEDAPAVLRKWRDALGSMPDEFTPIAIFWSVPPGFPEELVGTPIVIIAGVYAGSVDEGERVSAPLRMLATPLLDLSGPVLFTHVQSGFDGFFPTGMHYYWKSTYIEALSDEVIDALCALAAQRPSPRTTMDIWPIQGAAARVGTTETAFGRRWPFMVAFESSWFDEPDDAANIAWARDSYASVQRFDGGGVYLNFPGFGEEKEDLVRAAYGANYERLTAIKATYDPNNLFRMNQNIRPAAR